MEAVGRPMDKVSLRLSEEEKDLLRRQADEAGVSVSELIRDRLFPQALAGSPATYGQVSGLAEKVAVLSAAVERVAEKVESQPVPEPIPVSALEVRLDEIGLALRGLSGELAELKEVLSRREQPSAGWASFLTRSR